jgi:hypothetical protein
MLTTTLTSTINTKAKNRAVLPSIAKGLSEGDALHYASDTEELNSGIVFAGFGRLSTVY